MAQNNGLGKVLNDIRSYDAEISKHTNPVVKGASIAYKMACLIDDGLLTDVKVGSRVVDKGMQCAVWPIRSGIETTIAQTGKSLADIDEDTLLKNVIAPAETLGLFSAYEMLRRSAGIEEQLEYGWDATKEAIQPRNPPKEGISTNVLYDAKSGQEMYVTAKLRTGKKIIVPQSGVDKYGKELAERNIKIISKPFPGPRLGKDGRALPDEMMRLLPGETILNLEDLVKMLGVEK
jgi:hypothetical protein